jgi:Ca2+-binding RTX toxin-like protein
MGFFSSIGGVFSGPMTVINNALYINFTSTTGTVSLLPLSAYDPLTYVQSTTSTYQTSTEMALVRTSFSGGYMYDCQLYDDDSSTTDSSLTWWGPSPNINSKAQDAYLDSGSVILRYTAYMAGGDDIIKFKYSRDIVYLGDGNDTVYANEGNDTIFGGTGNDILSGGADKDAFVFDTALNAETNVDTITDFKVGQDTIRLDKAIFQNLGGKAQLSSSYFQGNSSGTAVDSDDYIIYNSSTGALFYDADGSGSGAAIQFATLSAGLALTTASIFVI